MQKHQGTFFNPITAINDLNRFRKIITVLVNHGLGQFVIEIEKSETTFAKLIQPWRVESAQKISENTTLWERIRLVLQDLGPTFIKLGQILSTRADLIPLDLQIELQKLQDNVPPFSFEEAKEQLKNELASPIEEIFSEFSETPLGTASIGQVYSARLKTGEEVVVKVQRPKVGKIVESDVALLRILAKSLEKRIPQLRTFDLLGILEEFHRAIQKELDYSNELRNALKFTENLKHLPDIIIPKVYQGFSTRKVLVMEKINGVKITEAYKVNSDPKILSLKAMKAIFSMVFENGFFHGDLHPGNIFALPNDRIAFIDLGITGRLDEEMRFKLADLTVAFLNRDVGAVSKAILLMGICERKGNIPAFRRDVGDIMDKVMGVPLKEIHSR